ncbi:envelope stress response membrane protein PspC [Alteromonadaceae bacterium BrNp21-10]|nr:envelope stress response membrane protein PspC [Alteromonadaceae bacterium BrNp21-10]
MTMKRELYRDPSRGKIAGVCAGLADYFGWELWLVRIIFVSAVLLAGGPFFIVAYVAAWFILDKKPSGLQRAKSHIFNKQQGKGWHNYPEEDKAVEVKTRVWQAGETPKQACHDIRERFVNIEQNLRKMETYVTSSEFQLNREISKL